MSKEIYVYLNDESLFLGTVYVDYVRGRETYSFEYSDFALSQGYNNIIIDEDIGLVKGRQYKKDSSKMYRFLLDSSPDRWGRNLIRRSNSNGVMNESDYLLNVSDISRMGALRFKTNKDDSFVSKNSDIPPMTFIRELEQIAYNYDDFDEDEKWRILLYPGSSLGGARPKATIYGTDKELYMAKFTHKNDDYDVSKIEYLTNLLAKEAGINIPEFKYLNVNSRGVFLTRRFDRDGNKRIHHISFMTIFGADDGNSSSHTYLDIAEKIMELSAKPKEDLRELFKRIAFYIMVHNYDNHLRNIGMLNIDGKLSLSPCFDINISPYKGNMVIRIDGVSEDNIETLIKYSKTFSLTSEEASKVIEEMKKHIVYAYAKYSKELKIDSKIKKQLDTFLSR